MNYTDKFVLVASKHNKEQAIRPVFRQILACNLCVEDIDTDQFGTFTGEVSRSLSAYETCILKATYAGKKKKYALSVASEGSFGPHPSNPFIPHAHEIMVFVDLENEWIIGEQLLTPNTNYKMIIIDNYSHLLKGNIYTISISEHTPKEEKFHYQLPNDEQTVAYELYDELRYADQSEAEVIVIELPPDQIKWRAIREKILKAGQRINSI